MKPLVVRVVRVVWEVSLCISVCLLLPLPLSLPLRFLVLVVVLVFFGSSLLANGLERT